MQIWINQSRNRETNASCSPHLSRAFPENNNKSEIENMFAKNAHWLTYVGWKRRRNCSHSKNYEKMESNFSCGTSHINFALNIFSFVLLFFYAIELARTCNGEKWNERVLYSVQHLLLTSSIFITSGFVIYADASARARYDFVCMQTAQGMGQWKALGLGIAGCSLYSETLLCCIFDNIFCFICIFSSYANAFKCVIDRRVTVQVYTHCQHSCSTKLREYVHSVSGFLVAHRIKEKIRNGIENSSTGRHINMTKKENMWFFLCRNGMKRCVSAYARNGNGKWQMHATMQTVVKEIFE